MTEYIRREAALEELNTPITMSVCLDKTDLAIKRMQRDRDAAMIRAIPAADVAPVVHGRWISAYPDIEPNPMFVYGICSRCGFEQSISDKLNYCPNCFAKMDLGKDGDQDG